MNSIFGPVFGHPHGAYKSYLELNSRSTVYNIYAQLLLKEGD